MTIEQLLFILTLVQVRIYSNIFFVIRVERFEYSMKTTVREIAITVILALIFFIVIRSVVHNFEVRGFSMEPDLHDGQLIIVSKAAYWFGSPHRGDIVVFSTSRLDHDIIHRIVGLPGEMVEINSGKLWVNGERVEEPYIQGHSVSVPAQTVPEDSYLIVGDNREAASWDIVPREDIIGKAWICYWPPSQWGSAPNYSWKSEVVESGVSDMQESALSYSP